MEQVFIFTLEKKLIFFESLENSTLSDSIFTSLARLFECRSSINKKKFLHFDKIMELRELLMINELTGSPSNINNKQYLDELLLKLN